MISHGHDNEEELFPVIDEQGQIIDAATRGECHGGSMLLHPVVHLHIFNSDGEIYLQKRPLWKDIQPGRWDTAVGGHVTLGENVESALRRETKEELGIDISERNAEALDSYVFTSEREREMVYAYRIVWDEDINPSEETDGGRFWTPDEIAKQMDKGVFTPNFEREYRRLFASVSRTEDDVL